MHPGLLAQQARLPERARVNRTGVWLFLLSEAMIFVVLISTRFILAGSGHPEVLNQPLALIMTIVLLGSGWPVRSAVTAIRSGDRGGMLRNLWWTIVLGAFFLILMAFEWAQLGRELPRDSLYGTAFFSTTGFHGFHVLIGVLLLVSMALQGRKGAFTAENYSVLEGAERYWHFVDLAWVFIYPSLYLL